MTETNLADAGTFAEVLRAALERAGALTTDRVALVLPDPVARVALLPGPEVPGGRRAATEELLRFKLRKSVPFDVRDARLAFASSGSRAADTVVVAAVYKPVLEGYEAACRAVGVHPGLVELSGLALLNSAFGALPAADRLLVNWDEGYVTLLLARGEWPLVRLGGTRLDHAVLRSAALPPAQAAALLEDPLEMRPELIEPWRALRVDHVGAVGQALAGAAACLVGSRS
jgi:hypothetical protein